MSNDVSLYLFYMNIRKKANPLGIIDIIDVWVKDIHRNENCLVNYLDNYHIVNYRSLKAGKVPTVQSALDKELYITRQYNYQFYCKKYKPQFKSIIKFNCRLHGTQTCTLNRWYQGGRCKKCSKEFGLSKRQLRLKHQKTEETLLNSKNKLEYLNKKYPRAYIAKYSNPKNTLVKYNCRIHGTCVKYLSAYQKTGNYCTKCLRDLNKCTRSSKTTFKRFVKKANKIHNNKYSYHKDSYNKIRDKTKITCPLHGDFYKTGVYHLEGLSCLDCKKIKKDRSPKIYIVKFSNKNESFIKLGLTTQDVKDRFSNEYKYYNIETLNTYELTNNLIAVIEKEVHDYFDNIKYTPKIKFGGFTECYKTEDYEKILIKLLTIINEYS